MTAEQTISIIVSLFTVGFFAFCAGWQYRRWREQKGAACKHRWGKWVDDMAVYKIPLTGQSYESAVQWRKCELCNAIETHDSSKWHNRKREG